MGIQNLPNKVPGITIFGQYVYTNLQYSIDKVSIVEESKSDDKYNQPKDTTKDKINCSLMMKKINL